MYVLSGKIGRLGFVLTRGQQQLFSTQHKWGLLRTSYCQLADDKVTIRPTNLVGDKFKIIKNGAAIGRLSFAYYQFSTIILFRNDGGQDNFRLDEDSYSFSYILSQSGRGIMCLTGSLNPLRIDDKFTIEILSNHYPRSVLEELMLYAGEILFRSIRPSGGGL